MSVRTRSRRRRPISWSRTLAHATYVPTNLWHKARGSSSHPCLLSPMFHEGPGNNPSALPADRTTAMILFDGSGQVPDRESDQRSKVSTSPGASCPRCGGLLILDYVTSTGRDTTGRPAMARRCVNCGNCMDPDIMTNRRKGSERARPHTRRARPPTGLTRNRQPRGKETGGAW